MHTSKLSVLSVAILLATGFGVSVRAATELQAIEVTSGKLEHDLDRTSASVTVVDAADLRARGARDLGSALAMVAGVEATPGGDGGPASSVPALWGLREFDAFLLLVDGVPWGGAFVPALASIDLTGVERIEVMRGAAPVSYGATAFVGVIHVIHYAPGEVPDRIEFGLGSRGSSRSALTWSPQTTGAVAQSFAATLERQELAADRADYDRAHLQYRAGAEVGSGQLGFDGDVSILKQDPASPFPREGRQLSVRVPIDANHNPSDAEQDENRAAFRLHYQQDTALGAWSSLLAYAHTDNDTTKGFLREDFSDGSSINADGFRQNRNIDDLYFDTHLVKQIGGQTRLLAGADYLYGNGQQDSQNFEYAVRLDGRQAPSSFSRPIDEFTDSRVRRHFLGGYVEVDYAASEKWNIDAGVRINYTDEKRAGAFESGDGSESEASAESRNTTRLTGALGTSYRFWQDAGDDLVGYANYKNTFKPAVADLGPEAEAEILKPEKASSGEIGLRGHNLQGKLDWNLALFYMDFNNLVLTQAVNGLPSLTNAGNENFKGIETEAHYTFAEAWTLAGSWSYHEARFGDSVQLFGDTPTQLLGNDLELSPNQLYSLGLLFDPHDGLTAHVGANYVGDRFLSKRNTSFARSYVTWDAGVGFQTGHWAAHVDAYNLSNRRDVVSESEIGDAQYYRLPARSLWVSLSYDFGG